MIRRMLRLAVDAAKFELARLFQAVDEADAAADAVATPPSKWTSSAYHLEVLGSSVCPRCESPKLVGAYRCKRCVDDAVREAYGLSTRPESMDTSSEDKA